LAGKAKQVTVADGEYMAYGGGIMEAPPATATEERPRESWRNCCHFKSNAQTAAGKEKKSSTTHRKNKC